MLYELRIYECVPGRLPDLNKRFDTITLKIWEKHGIKQAGFWTTLIGKNNQRLYYLLQWESLAEREKKWNAFGADPDGVNKGTLLRVWDQSGVSGELVVRLPAGCQATSATAVDLRGEKTGAIVPIQDGKLILDLHAYAPASFILD